MRSIKKSANSCLKSYLFLQYTSHITHDSHASLAQIRMFTIGPDTWPIVPAALAFIVTALFCGDCSLTCRFYDFDLTDNTKSCELIKTEFIQKSSKSEAENQKKNKYFLRPSVIQVTEAVKQKGFHQQLVGCPKRTPARPG